MCNKVGAMLLVGISFASLIVTHPKVSDLHNLSIYFGPDVITDYFLLQ